MPVENMTFCLDEDILNNYVDVTKTDLDGVITYASQMFCDTVGYAKGELIGKSHNIVKDHNTDKSIYENLWNQISNNQPFVGVIKNTTKQGATIWFEVLIRPYFNDKNEKVGYIAYRKNITTQKQLQSLVDEQVELIRKKDRQLNEQAKILAMGKMIENIAHQWRQPLSLISTVATGLILKLEHDMFEKNDALINLHKLEESSQYLSHTIDDFRDFFKTDKIKKRFNLNNNCKKCLSMVQASLNSNRISVIKNEKDSDIIVNGYENELSQAIINILNNSKDVLSVKNCEEKFIFTSIEQKGDNAIITIADNGGGIADDIINKIFEPYFTTKHKSQGTGIGLYMTKEIIEKHFHGEISVQNEDILYNGTKYYGAKFTIILPIE